VFLAKLAQDCLGSGLTGEDAELVRDVRKHLGIFASKMRFDQGKITGPFPSSLAPTMWDSLTIIAGILGEIDTKKPSREEFRKIQTQPARDAKGKRKKATLEAIKKIRGEGPSEHPYKEGGFDPRIGKSFFGSWNQEGHRRLYRAIARQRISVD
jgi:hypothetical protein